MSPAPDLSALTLPELVALNAALRAAIRAADGAGGAFECGLLADAEGVSVTFTILINPQPQP